MNRYTPELEAEMRAFYLSLSEKDRRRYAAIEARKLGYAGHSYIATVLGCERHTVATGIEELRDPSALEQGGIRQPGGGRNSLAVVEESFSTIGEGAPYRDRTVALCRDEKLGRSQALVPLAGRRNRH